MYMFVFHSSIEEQLSCFHLRAIMNTAATKICLLSIVSIFHFSNSKRYVVVSCHSVNMHFLTGQIFMCPFAIHVSLIMCLFKSLAHFFKIGLFSYCWVFRVLYFFSLLVLCWICDLQNCLPLCSLLFYSLISVFHRAKLYFAAVQFINSFPYGLWFWCRI